MAPRAKTQAAASKTRKTKPSLTGKAARKPEASPVESFIGMDDNYRETVAVNRADITGRYSPRFSALDLSPEARTILQIAGVKEITPQLEAELAARFHHYKFPEGQEPIRTPHQLNRRVEALAERVGHGEFVRNFSAQLFFDRQRFNRGGGPLPVWINQIFGTVPLMSSEVPLEISFSAFEPGGADSLLGFFSEQNSRPFRALLRGYSNTGSPAYAVIYEGCTLTQCFIANGIDTAVTGDAAGEPINLHVRIAARSIELVNPYYDF